jgi:hypothetical protein
MYWKIQSDTTHIEFLVLYPALTNETMTTKSQRYICFIRIGEMPSHNMPVQKLNVTILPLGLPCSGLVTHSGEILTTGKSHKKEAGRFYFIFNITKSKFESTDFSSRIEMKSHTDINKPESM